MEDNGEDLLYAVLGDLLIKFQAEAFYGIALCLELDLFKWMSYYLVIF